MLEAESYPAGMSHATILGLAFRGLFVIKVLRPWDSLLQFHFGVFIMGITESKILLGKLATACSSAERNKQNGIQHVLSDKQVSSQSAENKSSLIKASLSGVLRSSGIICLIRRRTKSPVANAAKNPSKNSSINKLKSLHF